MLQDSIGSTSGFEAQMWTPTSTAIDSHACYNIKGPSVGKVPLTGICGADKREAVMPERVYE